MGSPAPSAPAGDGDGCSSRLCRPSVRPSVRPSSLCSGGLIPLSLRASGRAQPAAPELEAASPFSMPAAQGEDSQGQPGTAGDRRVPHAQGTHGSGKGWMWHRSAAELGRVEGTPTPPGTVPRARTSPGTVPRAPTPPGTVPRAPQPLLTALGGPCRAQPFSGRCRGTGRARRPPAAGPGGSAAAPPAQPHVPLPAASVGTQRAMGRTGIPQNPGHRGLGPCPEWPHHTGGVRVMGAALCPSGCLRGVLGCPCSTCGPPSAASALPAWSWAGAGHGSHGRPGGQRGQQHPGLPGPARPLPAAV